MTYKSDLGGFGAPFGRGLGGSWALLGHFWACLCRFLADKNPPFCKHWSNMVVKRPLGTIWGRFGEDLERIWGGLGGFGSFWGQILNEIREESVVHIYVYIHIFTYIYIYRYMQVFARVYNTFPSLLYVETPALPRFASRSVTMRGGLLRVLDFAYTLTSIITFMGGASPPWSGVRGDRRHFVPAPFWRVLGPS